MTVAVSEDRYKDKNAGSNPYKMYEIIRQKIEQEDSLVNQRIMWMITLNGLLFAAYGFLLKNDPIWLQSGDWKLILNGTYSGSDLQAKLLLMGIVFAGVGSSCAALLGVIAAFRAIRDNEYFMEKYLKANTLPRFPSVIGRKTSNVMGMISGISVPFIICGAWIVISGWFSIYKIYIVGVLLLLFLVALYWCSSTTLRR